MDWLKPGYLMGLAADNLNPLKEFLTVHQKHPIFDYEAFYTLTLELLIKIGRKTKLTHKKFVKVAKTKKASRELRKAGNDAYVASTCPDDFLRALEIYTRSIAHAPIVSEEIVLGYSNRAVVLFRLNLYEDCLQDLERALTVNHLCSDQLKLKLEFRKAECLGKLSNRSYAEAKFWLNEVLPDDPCKQDCKDKLTDYTRPHETYIEQETVVPTIPSPNSKFGACASDAVDFAIF